MLLQSYHLAPFFPSVVLCLHPCKATLTPYHATRHYGGGSKELFPPRDAAIPALVSFRNWTLPIPRHSLQPAFPPEHFPCLLPSTCKHSQRMQEIIKMKFSLLKMAKLLFFSSRELPVTRRWPHRVCREWLVVFLFKLSFHSIPSPPYIKVGLEIRIPVSFSSSVSGLTTRTLTAKYPNVSMFLIGPTFAATDRICFS